MYSIIHTLEIISTRRRHVLPHTHTHTHIQPIHRESVTLGRPACKAAERGESEKKRSK